MPKQHEEDPDMTYDRIQAQLHEMSGSIGSLKGTIETMTRVWQQQEATATAGRRVVHDKVDVLTTNIHSLTSRVDQMNKDIVAIQPAVKVFHEEKLRAEGAKRLGRYLWGLMLTAAGGLGWGIHEVIAVLHHPPPPP